MRSAKINVNEYTKLPLMDSFTNHRLRSKSGVRSSLYILLEFYFSIGKHFIQFLVNVNTKAKVRPSSSYKTLGLSGKPTH